MPTQATDPPIAPFRFPAAAAAARVSLIDRGLKHAFIWPTLVFLIAFNVFPLAYNIVLGFTDALLTGGESKWVGGQNYTRIFETPRYVDAIRTTGLFVLIAVSCELLLGFVLALALRRAFRGKAVILTLLLVPMMLSPAVMGLYWHQILNGQYGVLNQMIAALDRVLPGPALPQPQWVSDPRLMLSAILLIDIWMWTPFMMLIALAGLNSIPAYIYEAAQIDRASTWTVFRRITLPMCMPLLLLAALLRTTDAIKQFDLVMAVTGPNYESTRTLSVQLYQEIFSYGRVGVGSAYACIVLVIVIALAAAFTRYIDYIQGRQGRSQP